MGDELVSETMGVAVVAFLYAAVTIPCIVVFLVTTAEPWDWSTQYRTQRGAQNAENVRRESTEPATRARKDRPDISMLKGNDRRSRSSEPLTDSEPSDVFLRREGRPVQSRLTRSGDRLDSEHRSEAHACHKADRSRRRERKLRSSHSRRTLPNDLESIPEHEPQSFDDWMEEMLEKERLKKPSLDSYWMCKMSSSLDPDGPAVVEPRMNERRLRREQGEAEDDGLDDHFIVRPRPGSSSEGGNTGRPRRSAVYARRECSELFSTREDVSTN